MKTKQLLVDFSSEKTLCDLDKNSRRYDGSCIKLKCNQKGRQSQHFFTWDFFFSINGRREMRQNIKRGASLSMLDACILLVTARIYSWVREGMSPRANDNW